MIFLICRKIRGPFSVPSDINIIKQSLICAKDYDNIDLLKADPNKEFLWNSYDVASVGLVANNGKTIICGRAIVRYISHSNIHTHLFNILSLICFLN